MVDENVVPYLLKKLNVNMEMLSKALDGILDAYPKVTGGDQYLSGDSDRALQKAVAIAQEAQA